MIVLKYSYDTSICASYYPTFNNGYTCTKKESTKGTIKTITYESDTAFTSVSFPSTTSTPRSCITKVDWIDLSSVSGIGRVLTDASNMTSITFANATSKLTDVNHACYSCSSLIEVNFIDCDLSSVNSTQNIFNNGCSNVIQKATYRNVKFGDGSRGLINTLRNAPTMIIENINTDALTSCYQMFLGCIGLVGTLDLSCCNFTNILNFDSMFNGCTNLVEISMPKGRYEKATNMSNMFSKCTSLKKVVLDDFITPNVTSFNGLFSGCTVIEEVDLSSLGAYKTRGMNNMFTDCFNLKKLNMSGIGTVGDYSMSHFTYNNTAICPVEWLDMSNIKHIPNQTQNMWRIGDHIRNIGMLYCPAEVINYHLSQMRIPSTLDGYKINIYYHDANSNELKQDDRFNYIYCEEYHGDVVTTPNDLELHGLYYYGNPLPTEPSVCDSLDLTTGTITRNIYKFQLNDILDKLNSSGLEARVVTINETEMLRIAVNHYNSSNGLFPYKLENLVGFISQDGSLSTLYSQGSYDGTWRTTNIEQAYGNSNSIIFLFYKGRFTDEEVTNMTSSDGAISNPAVKTWLASKNFTIFHQATPYTEQIAKPKALRCYYNGSIITDSQQLVPKLVTTLPIANKFETTKLVNGKTYLVYFDGTATELNVGGETVIANPTSPCEFTCGSTKTLTITGTDIANVMVVEKEQKNEQHEINATSVHIDRIRTRNDVYNYFDDYVRKGDWGKPYDCNSIRDLNSIKITGLGGLCYDGYVYNNGNLAQGTYRFRCKVKVAKIGDKYKVNCSSNPNGNSPGQQFGTGDVTSTQLIEEIDIIVYIKNANAMLFYTFYNGQKIEYYDISFIKLSDEDITSSSDIPNISYEETISTPSEPIVLRSYGGVQDTYDIATGIVTKRVTQSVDSFDLGALSSPETHIVTFDKMPVIYENGTVEFFTEHGLYPIAKFEVPSSNTYDVSNLEANKQYTIRNANQIYCNGQSVPVREVMTFTTSQLAKGEMVINNSNDKEPMIIEGNYGSRDIPNFKGARSVEALEISVDGAVNQPVFGKGGRR